MPQKIRQLKAALARAGFTQRPAKGSHTMWVHPAFPGSSVTISGKDGDDAEKYQVKDVRHALKKLGEKL
ncbi:MAG: type II toxin-antitoxin system HicA family toxin [Chloroflexi bacterium]|nr:MAG: type II toxin-antitoxin system HicA family toxin [Chloroflexota bacterium]